MSENPIANVQTGRQSSRNEKVTVPPNTPRRCKPLREAALISHAGPLRSHCTSLHSYRTPPLSTNPLMYLFLTCSFNNSSNSNNNKISSMPHMGRSSTRLLITLVEAIVVLVPTVSTATDPSPTTPTLLMVRH